MPIDPVYFVAEPLRDARRTLVRLASRFLRASYLGPLGILTLSVPYPALAAPRTFSDLAAIIVNILNTGAAVLILFGLVTYFWGVAINIPHFGDEKGAEKVKAYFFWGIIVLFVMVSIWGIVQILQNTLFGGAPFHPSTGEPVNSLCDGFGDC